MFRQNCSGTSIHRKTSHETEDVLDVRSRLRTEKDRLSENQKKILGLNYKTNKTYGPNFKNTRGNKNEVKQNQCV